MLQIQFATLDLGDDIVAGEIAAFGGGVVDEQQQEPDESEKQHGEQQQQQQLPVSGTPIESPN